MSFLDRHDAGRRLAERLESHRGPAVVVLGLPRGGVPVAYEVATALGVPLDIVVSRKLVVPDRPWLVFGAVGEGGVRVTDSDFGGRAFISADDRAQVAGERREQLRRSVARYRRGDLPLPLDSTTALIIDDGLATGATAHVARGVARARGAARVVFATPVGSCRALRALTAVADQVICLHAPQLHGPIRPWYKDFAEVTDDEVCALLDRAGETRAVHA
ncbi:phosphoribosyltransferase [Nocardia sp. NPDC049149]|uniref:phosphoribosyltransferase n=1 Tax=Nocardia sp. NPDC049149 TaxID=3364315 RepID=UPI0037143300